MKAYAKLLTDDNRFAKMLFLELADLGVQPLSETVVVEKDDRLYLIADLTYADEEELLQYAPIATLIGFSSYSDAVIERKAAHCTAFLHRPFHMDDLRGLIDSSTRRRVFEAQHRTKPVPTCLDVDTEDRVAVWGDQRIPLSENECKVLSLLCRKRGNAITREELHILLGTEDGNMGDVYICHLRRKIDNKLGLKLILTVRGKGYMLKE